MIRFKPFYFKLHFIETKCQEGFFFFINLLYAWNLYHLWLTEDKTSRETLDPGRPAERRHIQRLRDHPPLRLLRRRRGRRGGRRGRGVGSRHSAPTRSTAAPDVFRGGRDLLRIPAGPPPEHSLEFVHFAVTFRRMG